MLSRTEPLLLQPLLAERPPWAHRRPYCPVLPDPAPSPYCGDLSFLHPYLNGDSVQEALQPVLACPAIWSPLLIHSRPCFYWELP